MWMNGFQYRTEQICSHHELKVSSPFLLFFAALSSRPAEYISGFLRRYLADWAMHYQAVVVTQTWIVDKGCCYFPQFTLSDLKQQKKYDFTKLCFRYITRHTARSSLFLFSYNLPIFLLSLFFFVVRSLYRLPPSRLISVQFILLILAALPPLVQLVSSNRTQHNVPAFSTLHWCSVS